MPDCSQFLAQFSDYLDGRLDRRVTRRVESHLRQCARCRAAVKALRHGVAELQAAGQVAPSPFFRERLAARLDQEVRIGDPVQPTSTGLAAALLIGAALGLTLLEPLLLSDRDVPLVADRTADTALAAFGSTLVRPAEQREPGFVPWVLPDVTLAFTHRDPPFSSQPKPAGTLALFTR